MTIRRTMVGAAIMVLAGACMGEGRLQSWGLRETRISLAATGPADASSAWMFQVIVPTGVDRDRLALAAETSLVLGDGVTISGAEGDRLPTISGLGSVSIGKGAQVGSVYGGSQTAIVLHDAVTVQGYVKASKKVHIPGSASIGIGILEDANDPGEAYRWKVAPPDHADGGDVGVATPPATLAPGNYESLVIEPHSQVVLRNGHYFLRQLDLRKRGALKIDDSEGAVYVWVQDRLVLASLPQCSRLPRFLLGYAGSGKLSIAGGFCGTLVAPTAQLELRGPESIYLGSFFAQSIELGARVRIKHEPFIWWRKP